MKAQLVLLALPDLQARGAQLAVQAPSDPQEDLDLRDHQELLERRECPERKDQWGQLVVMDCKAQWVSPAPQDHQELPERTETREKLESMVRRALREARENMVLLVHQDQSVQLASPVPLELMGRLERGVNRVSLDPRETKEQEDSQGLQVPSVFRDCPAFQERRERLETLAQWDLLVLQDPVALLVPTVLMVLKVLQEVSETQVLQERRESLASPVHLELEANQERRGLVESAVRRASRDNPERLDPLAEEDPRETTDLKATLALLVSLAILVPLVSLDQEEPMEQREREERTANKEKLALPDLLARMDHPDLLERGVPPEQEDLRAVRERRVPRVTTEQRDHQERQGQWDLRVSQENQEQRD